ncbi:MAG: hypothetical protein FRX48_05908 [Lasallia pustulata]|uniref:Uncharacterized protein n=1 Tax=Lasallia pustulata TaxID=136370 RepID=A0A5M8PNJ3_9LECA|nr:MAG: hypothetical protein FRX48_05908 [Lasallia pustulata]
MAGKKAAGENTKKAAGNAKATEAANQKAAAENAKKATAEEQEWSKGAKSNAKQEAEDQKKAEAARKKAEKDALLAAEEKDARATPKNSKTATKKTRGLDLSQLDAPTTSHPALNATGIDNALDALSLTSANPSDKVDRQPERRFKGAYAAYEARRLPELEEELKGLRRQQRIDVIRKEFERSPENPFNQANARFDSTREEVKEIREVEKEKVERRLGGE